MTAHGERAEAHGHAGREYWSRRPGRRMGIWGRVSKWITHRAERARSRREALRALDAAQRTKLGTPDADPVDYEDR